MSDREIVNAYLDGRVSRRTLIRRLVAAGVSIGAAVSYAQVLKPERAFARADSDHYPDTEVKIIDEDLDKVANKERVRVRVHADEDAELSSFSLRAFHVTHDDEFTIGEKGMSFKGPDTKIVNIPISPGAAAVLKERKRAKIKVRWFAYDAQGKIPNGVDVNVFEA
jgi:hypothetical protein